MADEQDNTTQNQPPHVHSAEEIKEVKDELKQAIHRSHEVLARATTVFPFTLFPDTVIIDRAKLTITHRSFVQTADLMSIRIEDILNVTANVGPLFGSLSIVSRVLNSEKPFVIKFLWRDDALKLKRVLQGYVIAIQKEINCGPLETKELATMLNELGKDDHPEAR